MGKREWAFDVDDLDGASNSLRELNPRLETVASGARWRLLDDTDGPVWFAVGGGRIVMRRVTGRRLRPGDAVLSESYLPALRGYE